jgi:outer membrane protein, multidrug efflux system
MVRALPSGEAEGEARGLYSGGKVDFLTVLDAERTLASTRAEVAGCRATLVNSQISLFLALGGGWQ